MPISDQQPCLAAAAGAILACHLAAAPAAARHSDIPDLPPLALGAVEFTISAMQHELAALQSSTAALLFDPSPLPVHAPSALDARAALTSRRIDLLASIALRDLAHRGAPPSEVTTILAARASAQARIGAAIALHQTVVPMPKL